MGILQNIFSIKNQKEKNGKIYKVTTVLGLKLKTLNIKRTLSEVSKETKLLRTIIEKSIDITKIPKATGNLRKVQLIKTKILQIIDVILKKYHMQYWIDFGTLIGAIRHKGFIPWDDDIDLCIMKDDYLKLPEIFDKELVRYGLNYIYCDDAGSQLIKLCYNDYVVDFFPMEYINKKCYTEEEKAIHVCKWLECRNAFLKKYKVKDFISGKYNQFEVIPFVNTLKQQIIDISYKENSTTNQVIRSLETMTVATKCAVFDCEYIFPLQNLQFEDLSLPAPIDPLQHLYQSGEYGEYGAVMTFPRIQDSGFAHTQMNYSSDIDYDNILHELTNIYEEIKNENKVCTASN
ncbi:LicD family protein [bacterium]|nr:LicD family protein [bacterium]